MRLRLAIPLCIILGLLLSVALAWGCAIIAPAVHPVNFAHQRLASDQFRRVASRDHFGFTRRTECVFSERTDPETGVILIDTFADQTIAAGWPLPALQCANDAWLEITVGESFLSRTWNGQQQLRGGWPLEAHVDAAGHSVWRALPLQPVWPGFAIDWALWALALFVPLGLPTIVRRARRRRRGECLACGYNLRDGGVAHGRCPECGAVIRRQP